ncbi:hypothetical protein [Paenibacillus sp. FSL R7-0331]|uniref:hypothetical protein n=1 Tax=Paenibacillus sp. FSL R7-0331 TaxID=1536773 RepID=UPI0004F875DF|nr:hypothetical protein [Paenibacillus sp. FSL R7-0331]AIQ51716.1 hypothetical protein R70331_09430 [Paenibacillus sp. FSL R7-0331]
MVHRLSNGILTVDIAEPGTYNRTRFDWTGFITQVTLEEGKHIFCVPESLIPGQGSGGMGLCNEFGISRTIGYDEAAAGEWFPKPGVGLLRKLEDIPYDFTADYPLQPSEMTADSSSCGIIYKVISAECRGYSFILTKQISLDEDRLIIDYTLENTGSKPIHTEEYIHNFIGINGAPAGEGYELRLPGEAGVHEPESVYTSGLLHVAGDRIHWNAQPDRPFYCRLGGWEPEDADWYWELVHNPARAGVRESGSFRPERMALWGERHVISPEVFADISILPRHSKDWSRSYQFFTF